MSGKNILKMTDFVFGVENYCSVKFIGDESHPNRFAWFSDVEKLMMKNGFGIEEVINYGEEIFDIEGVNNYYILEYGNTKRYFKELMLNSFIINKHDLLEYYQPIDELIEKNLNFLYIIKYIYKFFIEKWCSPFPAEYFQPELDVNYVLDKQKKMWECGKRDGYCKNK